MSAKYLDCGFCRIGEKCPHRTKRVDDVFAMHVGDEYDGAMVIKVDREYGTVTLEAKEIYYAPGRWT
jgi:hypothetical protein